MVYYQYKPDRKKICYIVSYDSDGNVTDHFFTFLYPTLKWQGIMLDLRMLGKESQVFFKVNFFKKFFQDMIRILNN